MEKLTENLGIFVSFPLLMLRLLSALDNEENNDLQQIKGWKQLTSKMSTCVSRVNSTKGTQKTWGCLLRYVWSYIYMIIGKFIKITANYVHYSHNFCHSVHETREGNLAVLSTSTLILSSCLLITQVFRWHRHLPLKASCVSLQWVNPRPMGHTQHKLT